MSDRCRIAGGAGGAFFSGGYIYGIVNRAGRREPVELPEWDDWRRLFVNGVAAFVIFTVFVRFCAAAAFYSARFQAVEATLRAFTLRR